MIRNYDGEKTLFYVDPPYPYSTRTLSGNCKNNDFYRHTMTDDDHRDLARVLRGLKGMVILSGYPCGLYDAELYFDWHRVECEAMADGARLRTEVLWINQAAFERPTLPLFDIRPDSRGRSERDAIE